MYRIFFDLSFVVFGGILIHIHVQGTLAKSFSTASLLDDHHFSNMLPLLERGSSLMRPNDPFLSFMQLAEDDAVPDVGMMRPNPLSSLGGGEELVAESPSASEVSGSVSRLSKISLHRTFSDEPRHSYDNRSVTGGSALRRNLRIQVPSSDDKIKRRVLTQSAALSYVQSNDDAVKLISETNFSSKKPVTNIFVKLPQDSQNPIRCRYVVTVESPVCRVHPLLSFLLDEIQTWSFESRNTSGVDDRILFDVRTRSPVFSVSSASNCSDASQLMDALLNRVHFFTSPIKKWNVAPEVAERIFLDRIRARVEFLKRRLLSDVGYALEQHYHYLSGAGFILDEDLVAIGEQILNGEVANPLHMARHLLNQAFSSGRLTITSLSPDDQEKRSYNYPAYYMQMRHGFYDLIDMLKGRRKVEWDLKSVVHVQRPLTISNTSSSSNQENGVLVAYQIIQEDSFGPVVHPCSVRLSLELLADLARSILVSCQPATSPLLQQKWSSPVLLSKETPICKGFQPLLNDIRSLFVEITIKDLQSRSPYWTWVLRTSQTSLTVKQLLILEKFVTEALGPMLQNMDDTTFEAFMNQLGKTSSLLLAGEHLSERHESVWFPWSYFCARCVSRLKLEEFYLDQILSKLYYFSRPTECLHAFNTLTKSDVHNVWSTFLNGAPMAHDKPNSNSEWLRRKGVVALGHFPPELNSTALILKYREAVNTLQQGSKSNSTQSSAFPDVLSKSLTTLQSIADYVNDHFLLPAEGYEEDIFYRQLFAPEEKLFG